MLGHQPVAIKVMAADGLQGSAEFDNEVATLPRLRHAHIVRLLGVCRSPPAAQQQAGAGGAGGVPLPPLRCLVYELLPGGSVEEQLASQAARCVLPWWLRLRVAAQVASAVAYLHARPASEGGPLVHRDIKPANWFLDGRLNAKLGDFGLAVPAASSSSSSSSTRPRGDGVELQGTFAFLAPECRSSGTVSAAGDVFALGVSLLQLATGAMERLHDLPASVARGLAGGGPVSQLLDARAGAWDEAAGQRLLQLGLWCVSSQPQARPSSEVLSRELAKLWLAAEEANKQQQQQGGQQQEPRSVLATPEAPGQWGGSSKGGPHREQGGGGGFWRFLTNAV